MPSFLNRTNQISWFCVSLTFLLLLLMGPVCAADMYTLTPYANAPTITRGGVVVSPPIRVNDSVSVPISGALTGGGHNSSGKECVIDSTSWSFPGTTIAYSTDDGKTFTTGGGSASISNVDTTLGTATLNATFQHGGYFRVTFDIHVDYKSATCGDDSKNATGILYFAVDAEDFGFTLLDPTYLSGVDALTINQGEGVPVTARINSINGFNKLVTFGTTGTGGTNITASGSGTPPANGTVDAPVTVSVGSDVAPSPTPYYLYVRGSSTFGSVNLAHDQPLSVTVTKRGLTITRAGAHDEKVDANGNKSGDTIWSSSSILTGSFLTLHDLNTQTFQIGFLGKWSMTPTITGRAHTLGHEDVSFIWNPNESDDTYNAGIWKVPYGTIFYGPDEYGRTIPQGAVDKKFSQAITYTATDNITKVSKSVSYALAVHDPVEDMTDDNPIEVKAEGPLFGSSDTGEGLQVVSGGKTGKKPSDNNVPSCSRGQDTSIGLSLDFNSGIPLADWLPLEGFDVAVGGSLEHTQVVGQEWPLDVVVPPHTKTYPIGIMRYNRHTFIWREYDAGGEKIVHKADGSLDPHKAVRDVFTGNTVIWANPIGENDPLPEATPIVYVPGY